MFTESQMACTTPNIAFEGVNYRFVGRLGSLCLLEQWIRIMIFHDDDFVVDSIVFFPPLFPTGTQDLAFVVGGDGFSCFSCCWFLRRRLTASKASSTTTGECLLRTANKHVLAKG